MANFLSEQEMGWTILLWAEFICWGILFWDKPNGKMKYPILVFSMEKSSVKFLINLS